MLVCLTLWSECKTTKQHSLPLTVRLSFGAEATGRNGPGCGKVVPIEDLGMQLRGVHCPHVDILGPHKCNFTQTEDKEFDDLEERFHWVSLCVIELKNNVATYLDNLEVRTLQS